MVNSSVGIHDAHFNYHSNTPNNTAKERSCLDGIFPRNPVTGSREIRLVPESFEIFLGSNMYHSLIESQGGKYTKKNYGQLLEQIGKKLVSRCDRSQLPFEFSVIDSSTINAWCLPGGKIAFYKGIIEKMDEEQADFGVGKFTLEEKIAAVMGHEMTHACARHSAKSLEIGAFLFAGAKALKCALLIFIVRNDLETENRPRSEDSKKKESINRVAKIAYLLFSNLDGLILKLIGAHGSRSREFEADKFGMVYMHRAGYNPRAAIWVQKFLSKAHPAKEGCFFKLIGLFRSHPYSEDRVRANEETLKLIQTGKLK